MKGKIKKRGEGNKTPLFRTDQKKLLFATTAARATSRAGELLLMQTRFFPFKITLPLILNQGGYFFVSKKFHLRKIKNDQFLNKGKFNPKKSSVTHAVT
ncbi:MAG TPA: hypothetical protein DCG32_08570 [Sphaerochaeta sp.]|jgi:hypothetical protein|nr:hypothetical protein [Sphaerochaeta sp.]